MSEQQGTRRLAALPLAIVKNRLVQFAVLGGLIFALSPPAPNPRDIALRSDRLQAMTAAEDARTRPPGVEAPTLPEVQERQVEDELLLREALRLGLDKNDGIVRARLIQKAMFLAEEVGGASRPSSEADLRAFFEKNRDRWALPERFRLTQVFAHRREALKIPTNPTDPPPAGEPGPVDFEIEGSRDQIVELLGAPFADALDHAPQGIWTGPVASSYGWHLVKVLTRTPGRPASFEDVRPKVVEADSLFRRQEAVARFLESAFARYRVTLDGQPLRTISPSRRVAFHPSASGED